MNRLSCRTRELVPLLRETGMEVLYSEARDGHNWENWRDRLLEGLAHLFPGPEVECQDLTRSPILGSLIRERQCVGGNR